MVRLIATTLLIQNLSAIHVRMTAPALHGSTVTPKLVTVSVEKVSTE